MSKNLSKIRNIAFIGNYLPRKCGIATFTYDLLNAISNEIPNQSCWAIAINDFIEGYNYPSDVRFEINANRLAEYKLAAEFINISKVDIVCLQHEFGIYGGENGKNILALIQNLRVPLITTFHTVLLNPTLKQKTLVEKICEKSDYIIVMSHKAIDILKKKYSIQEKKLIVIPHGIPDLPFMDPSFYKDQFGVEGKNVLLTFGLLNPSKGIETVIDALPVILREYPNTVYIILGVTHPNILKEQGESYRHALQIRARKKGIKKNVIFYNRFADLKELCDFLGAADIYITPYLNKEQIVSGTLAYALGGGNAVISTPYWYAEELLSNGRGIIVDFNDSHSLASQVIDLINDKVKRDSIRKKAYKFTRKMVWKEVARKYIEVFTNTLAERLSHSDVISRKDYLLSTPFEMPELKLDHIYRLTDDVGILQHAKFIVPIRKHGYSTDNNARALIATILTQNLSPEDYNLINLVSKYLSFLLHAFNEKNRRFRNFMGYDRRWLDETGTDDCHGRAIWSLGITIGSSKIPQLADIALDTFNKAVSILPKLTSPRAWAFGIVGIHAYLIRFSGDSNIRRIREELAYKLYDLYLENASDNWQWIEEIITYDNGKIPEALLMSGQWIQNGDMVDAGIKMLEWLIKIQTNKNNGFSPIGNKGWYHKDGEKAIFDQQPIEAQSICEACVEAYKVTQNKKWISEARKCSEWFLGNNDINISLYDYKTGGCYDGLGYNGININQGAESTLAWLLTLLNMYSLDNLLEIIE